MLRSAISPTYRVGVDIGGTFTDVVVLDETTGALQVTKVPSVPHDPSVGFMNGFEQALHLFGLDPGTVKFVVHGTTVATNAIIQGRGAKAGLLTTDGFRDVLEIAYQTRPVLYDIWYEKPAPLVARRHSVGIVERIGPDGEIITPLDEASVRDAACFLVSEGVKAIAVAFLHSYRSPEHERRVKEIIGELYPEMPVVLSSDVAPEYREYPRTSTTVVNAVLLPLVGPYLTRLEEQLANKGVTTGLHLMTSSGGIIANSTAKAFPVQLVESGPAAGVIGAAFVSGIAAGRTFDHILALDIGGTTAKAALVNHGMPALADDFEVGSSSVPSSTSGRGKGYPVRTPVVSLVEIGAGGGSIASIDPGGALSVGPESAGADPGPACYGLGGEQPTITDANLVLGRLNPNYFLGGALNIDVAKAEAALERDVAKPLGIDVRRAAALVLDVANAKMVAALQLISVQRGIDPRDYALVPSGGAGPLHACAIAASLGVPTVVVPPTPGLNSALGLLATDLKHEFVRTEFVRTAKLEPDRLNTILGEMSDESYRILRLEGATDDRIRTSREVEMCYVGQNYPLRVPVLVEGELAPQLDAAFHKKHRELYGFASTNEPTTIVNIRLTAIGAVDRPILKPLASGDGNADQALKGTRRVFFGDAVECPIYERAKLDAGDNLSGPAIIEQMDSTTVVPPGCTVSVDASGLLIITVASDAE